MKVIYKRLYKPESRANGGTLSHIKNVINRTNVPTKPKNNVNAAEEFFMSVLIGHIIAAAMDFLNMQSLNDLPSCLSQLLLDEDVEVRRHKFHLKVEEMLSKYFNISAFDKDEIDDDDKVRAYAKEVLSLGVLLLEFKDSVREGDGERLMSVRKFLLLAFRASNEFKYSLEALTLLLQQKCSATTSFKISINVL
jgi:hypothetical protein